MENIERKKGSAIAVILNCLGIIMMLLAIFSIYNSNKYIEGLVLQGFEPSKQMVQVINYYITSVTPYVFYGICLFVFAYIVKKLEFLIRSNISETSSIEKTEKILDAEIEEEDDIVAALLREK